MSTGGRLTRGALAAAEDIASLSTRECLVFAQAVYEYGASQTAWSDIASILSKHPLILRPKNFFTTQSCVTIYNYLMNQASLERTSDIENKKASIHFKLAYRHSVERLAELKRDIAEEEEKFKSISQEIDEIRSGGNRLTLDDGTQDKLYPTKRQNNTAKKEKHKSPSNAPTPVPVKEASEDAVASEEGMNDVPTDTSLRAAKANEDHQTLPGEKKEDELPERQTRHSTRRRRSTGTSQSLTAPSPAALFEASSPDVASPTSPRAKDKSRSKSGRKPLSKGEQILPIHETTDEDSMQSGKDVEELPDMSGTMEETPQATEETQARDILVPSHESTPAPLGRGDQGKRRASDAEGFLESTRERKKAREESEPVDDAESPATPSASAAGTTKNQKERKRFQNVIYMLHSQISQHRNGTIFHNPIKPSEAPDYHDIVKRPMDLKTVKNRVRDGVVTTSSEYQRDIYLMFANSLMYNRPNSDIYTMAEEMMNDAEAHINSFRQTEGFTARTRV